MSTQLSLKQIKDIDDLPYYLKKLGELTIEDNNIVLNWSGNDTGSKSIGAGFTIQDGDGLGNDITFSIVPLNQLTTFQNQNEYISGSGSSNRGWATQLSDIVLNNNDNNNLNGQRVLKEGDVIVGGSIGSSYSITGQREVKILIKKIDSVGYIPTVSELSLGELVINIADGNLFALKRQNNEYVVTQINGVNGTNGTSGVDGVNGSNGTSGIDGVNGSNGTSGIDGVNGTNGTSGVDGVNGTNGTSGVDGVNGSNGTSGIDGVNGSNGTSGSSGTSITSTLTTGATVSFTTSMIYGTTASPISTNLTSNLTGAQYGLVQKIYHYSSTAPTFPSGWVRLGAGQYVTASNPNIIFAEWAGGTRIEYWIIQ